MGYKVVLQYEGGVEEEDDEVLDTEEEAEDYAMVLISNYRAGGEVLHLSNPGDYPSNEDEDVDYRIIETDD